MGDGDVLLNCDAAIKLVLKFNKNAEKLKQVESNFA